MDPSSDSLLATGERVLQSQPFSVLLGARLVRLAPGEAEIEIPVRPELLQQHGFVHGGVVAYLADNTLTFAGGSVWGDAVTAEVKVNYLRPGAGEVLRAVAHVAHAGRTLAVATCEVFSLTGDERVLVAVAQGTLARVGGAPETR